MDDEVSETGPAFEDLQGEKQKLDALILVRSWLKSMEWPSYVGTVHFSTMGFFLVYPTDTGDGFPKHFQTDMLGLLPITHGKLSRVFSEDDGNTSWHGNIAMSKAPEMFNLKAAIDIWPGFSVIFQCGQKTDCKLVQKEITKTVWEMDCSKEARDEVKAGAQDKVGQ